MQSIADNPQLDLVRECVLLGRKWRARVDERMKPTGMTLARSTVLYWLSVLPEVVTQRELADTVGIEGPTLVRQLHALESQGLIERVPFDGDRRAKGIRLTDAALPLLMTIKDVTDALCAEHFGKLEKRRLASATRLVRDARSALE